jgi:hypothetical protein
MQQDRGLRQRGQEEATDARESLLDASDSSDGRIMSGRKMQGRETTTSPAQRVSLDLRQSFCRVVQ